MTRYSYELCECVQGTHVKVVEDSDGDYVRWEDVQELLQELRDYRDQLAGDSV